jgi:hypothetical protein
MTSRTASDRSSNLRKRALRKLSHEHYPEYSALYEHVLAETPGMTRHCVRSRAWTQLRYQFPDRYLELYALEQADIEDTGKKVPPEIRSRCWQRANTRLAHSNEETYQARLAEFRGPGITQSKAYDRAVAALRARYGELFARLLAEEYQLHLAKAHRSAGGCQATAAEGQRDQQETMRAGEPPGAAAAARVFGVRAGLHEARPAGEVRYGRAANRG